MLLTWIVVWLPTETCPVAEPTGEVAMPTVRARLTPWVWWTADG
jgi:hypothetical protein